MKVVTALLPLSMPLVLVACLGGGGGNGSNGPLALDSRPTPFTSFEDITANSLVEGTAATSVNYAADIVPASVPPRPDLAGVLTTTGSSALRFLTGDEIEPDDPADDPAFEFGGLRLTVNVPGRSPLIADFLDEADGAGVGLTAGRFVAFEIADDVDAVTDRLYLDQNDDLSYLTYGIWEFGIGGESVDFGGAAWGASTPLDGAGSMPLAGEATYTGDLIGHNVRGGSTAIYVADTTIAVDFGAAQDQLTFSSTNTRTLLDDTPDFGLNILPTQATISGNTFSSSEAIDLQARLDNPLLDLAYDGSFSGTFFGPEAAEAGGWFDVVGTGSVGTGDRYFGSFGGVRGAITPP